MDLFERYPTLRSIEEDIYSAYIILENCFSRGGKLLIAGNGGSAADADHIVGELLKAFIKKRFIKSDLKEKLEQVDLQIGRELSQALEGALPAMRLGSQSSFSTAFANDKNEKYAYAQEIIGMGNKNDVFLAITTSGNSKNILFAGVAAKAKGMQVIALTGGNGGEIRNIADVSVCVPEEETHRIQELHIPIYHAWCLKLEAYFFDE